MAALSIRRSLINYMKYSTYSSGGKRNNSRRNIYFSCQSSEPIRFSSDPKKNDQEKIKVSKIFSRLTVNAEKLGKELKDSLSPKKKGDWKDVMLMSISFAVYVYISQLIVTAYCSWVSMFNQ
ncbi:hypothetical protein FRX31_017290 [Thalictrum thalictroides]|uniref:Uncharacterized protein n=1 Tax=Thalictrum thalictroides TaxID=46969 RepID=A0A7J6W7A0_THATH|nr:hypothetical protein FRX31_017290 [Thalictrum thalictroides]